MIYLTRAILIVIAFAFLFITSDSSFAGDVANGKTLYESKCLICHGAEGTPMMPGIPIFSKGETLEKDAAVLKKSIVDGITPEGGMAPPMPPMQGQMSDTEIDDVLAYIFSLKL